MLRLDRIKLVQLAQRKYYMNKNQSDNVESLLRITEIVRQHAGDDDSEWFCNAIDNFLNGGDLSTCLGLISPHGKNSALLDYRYKLRDKELHEAFKLVDEPKIENLHLAVEAYRADPQPIQPDWSKMKCHIARAFNQNLRVPTTTESLKDIINSLGS